MSDVRLTNKGLKELGACLVKYREDKGWSQRDAARYISDRTIQGLTASALGRIEEGKVSVKLDTLLMLAQIGYGDLSFTQMVNLATERRLAVCERPSPYKVCQREDPIAV